MGGAEVRNGTVRSGTARWLGRVVVAGLLVLGGSVELCAQGQAEAMLALADRFYAAGNYEASATESWRFLHAAPDHPKAYHAYFRAGTAEYLAGQGTQATRLLQHALRLAPDAATKRIIRYRLAVTLIGEHEYELAKLELMELTVGHSDRVLQAVSDVLTSVVYAYQQKWPQARAAAARARQAQAANPRFTTAMHAADSVLAQLEAGALPKRPGLAKGLSTVLPGSGQLYAGEPLDGLNALAVNAGTSYLVVRAATSGSLRNAVISALTLWWRYYQGNRLHAEEAAIQANQRYEHALQEAWYGTMQEAMQALPDRQMTLRWDREPTPAAEEPAGR